MQHTVLHIVWPYPESSGIGELGIRRGFGGDLEELEERSLTN
jgi:hypothetical protein